MKRRGRRRYIRGVIAIFCYYYFPFLFSRALMAEMNVRMSTTLQDATKLSPFNYSVVESITGRMLTLTC